MRETVTLTNGSVYETGCYVAGHHGWRGVIASIRIAESEGFAIDADSEAAIVAYDDGEVEFTMSNGCISDTAEWVITLNDESIDYLNSVTPDGWSWGWYDGEFFLWPITEWEECP
jgi:hypothetical protein